MKNNQSSRRIKISANNMATALKIIKERYGTDVYILDEKKEHNGVSLIISVNEDSIIEQKTIEEYVCHSVDKIEEHIEEQVDGKLNELNSRIEEIPSFAKIEDLSKEIEGIKAYLEYYLPKLITDKIRHESATKALILKHMVSNGYSTTFANNLIASLPDSINAHNYYEHLILALEKRMSISPIVDFVQNETVLFIGSGGAGKTSAIIKLLKMLSIRMSSRSINVVGMPSNCIAEHEALKKYAGILSTNFYEMEDISKDKLGILNKFKATNLIDCSQYIPNRVETISDVKKFIKHYSGKVKVVLVLSGVTKGSAIEQLISTLRNNVELSGVILSKLDESNELGGIMEKIIINNLPIYGVINTEDKTKPINVPSAKEIIRRTLDNSIGLGFSEVSMHGWKKDGGIGVSNAV